MVEALATAGEHLGLDHTVSLRLARATVAGAGAMAVSNDPAELRRQVASPGGTTQAALEVLLEQTGFIDMIEHALALLATGLANSVPEADRPEQDLKGMHHGHEFCRPL